MAVPLPRYVQPQPGTMNARLFENPYIGLARTLFYDITIPLEPFDSGLSYEEQPVETAFQLEFLRFLLNDWRAFDDRDFTLAPEDSDGSIYLGAAHNPVHVSHMHFARRDRTRFQIDCTLYCVFEQAGVGDNTTVELKTDVEFIGLFLERGMIHDPLDVAALRTVLQHWVPLDAYLLESRVDQWQVLIPPRAS